MTAVVAAEREGVGEYRGATRDCERGLQHHRLIHVPAAHPELTGRADREPPADGSMPHTPRHDAAVRLLQGRIGCIDVVRVAHLSSAVRLTADAIVEMENVVIVIGSSSHAAHRMVGSVAVSLARHSAVPS
jgi:hypothetical protein